MDITSVDCADGIPTVGSFTDEPYFYPLLWALLAIACAVASMTLAVSVRYFVRTCRSRRYELKPVPTISVLDMNPLDQMPQSVDRSFCMERCSERGVCFSLGAGQFKCVCYEADDFSANCNGVTATPSTEGERVDWELIAALVVALVVLMSFLAVCCGFWRRRCRECVDGGARVVPREAAKRCGEAPPGPPAGEVRREAPACG